MEIPFSFRVKIGEQEIEISGTRDEVMKTLEELPRLIENVQKAFELTKNRETVQSVSSVFPSISSSSCSEAVFAAARIRLGQATKNLNRTRRSIEG